MPAPLRGACDGLMYGSLGSQLARAVAEQGDGSCKLCGFNVVWYNGLRIVDVEYEKQW